MGDALGMNPREKAELSAYQLKDVAQVCIERWRDERPLREGLVDWEVFKMSFRDSFFPIKFRERNLVEFMNLSRGNECQRSILSSSPNSLSMPQYW